MATKNGTKATTKATPAKLKKILELINKSSAKDNYFFVSTFERYQVQIKILTELQQSFTGDGALTTKEYVKGRENIYVHPAITEYNKTATAANGTVATLINILKAIPADNDGGRLQEMLNELNNG